MVELAGPRLAVERIMPNRVLLFIALILVPAPVWAQDIKPRPMQVDDLFRFKRLSDPQMSPDGKWALAFPGYSPSRVDLLPT